MKRLYLMLLASVLLFAACEREDPSLSLNPTSFELLSEGGSQTIRLGSNYDWTATTSDPWIRISPASGKRGETTITVTVETNSAEKSRKGSVSVTCRDLTRSVSVSQLPAFSQEVVIKHQATVFQVPLLSGSGISGRVNWGDGQEEFYNAALKHSYSSAGNFTVSIKTSGAVSFDLESVAAVQEIDFEKF